MNRLPKPSSKIIQIRERNSRRKVAVYNVSTRMLEIKQHGIIHRVRLSDLLDTNREIIYTDTDG